MAIVSVVRVATAVPNLTQHELDCKSHEIEPDPSRSDGSWMCALPLPRSAAGHLPTQQQPLLSPVIDHGYIEQPWALAYCMGS